MSAVELTIAEPQNGEVFFQGETHIPMVGQVGELPAELAGVDLFYRWYSSLFPSAKDRYSINVNPLSDPATPFDAPLGVGSHVISLAASDQDQETEAAQNTTLHGGVTGGSQGEKQCIIHLFKATIVAPQPSATLNRAGSTLDAEAPLQWWRTKPGTTDIFEPNPEYHGINRILYRWIFEPSPADGRATKILTPPVETLTRPSGSESRVRYAGPLPSGLGTGNYTLKLRVEDKNDPNVGNQTSRAVVLT